VCVCARFRAHARPILGTHRHINFWEGRWRNWFYPITQQPTLFYLWSILKDVVTTLCSLTALCQIEHPVRRHLNQSCKTCVSLLSVPMKGDVDDIVFCKVCILPDLGNWWRNMYLCVFEIPLITSYACHKQGHVTQFYFFILLNQIF
jgi:hypothetical protein